MLKNNDNKNKALIIYLYKWPKFLWDNPLLNLLVKNDA